MQAHQRTLIAEFFGTFSLVFAGTGAIVINQVSGGAVTHVGIALTFGLIVLSMIYAVGDVSGCHLNPAVTVGLVVAGRFSRQLLVPYVISQCAGALLASLVLKCLFPESTSLGATLPAGSEVQSFVLEFLLTLILMFVILSMISAPESTRAHSGLVIGAVVALEALFAGPISGASMNPARSLAPAVVSTNLQSLWVYLLAPTLGAVAGVYLNQAVRGSECLQGSNEHHQIQQELHR
jgi:aquaporin NIP